MMTTQTVPSVPMDIIKISGPRKTVLGVGTI